MLSNRQTGYPLVFVLAALLAEVALAWSDWSPNTFRNWLKHPLLTSLEFLFFEKLIWETDWCVLMNVVLAFSVSTLSCLCLRKENHDFLSVSTGPVTEELWCLWAGWRTYKSPAEVREENSIVLSESIPVPSRHSTRGWSLWSSQLTCGETVMHVAFVQKESDSSTGQVRREGWCQSKRSWKGERIQKCRDWCP